MLITLASSHTIALYKISKFEQQFWAKNFFITVPRLSAQSS